MPKWKKDAKEFTVSVNYNESRGYQSSIPKPVIDILGDPDSITFEIHGNTIRIKSGITTIHNNAYKGKVSNNE
ncbi:MAG: hypothetical protein HRU07_06595 [Nitrosopumilus sp.]|nr:hypothetical protein [Nitrosopumilus sp.]NRA05809.1 hypothetical protein [Nitrosopumilus sp.]